MHETPDRDAALRCNDEAGRRDEAGRYRIHVGGHLGGRWTAWFDGLDLVPQADGTTLIEGWVIDQAALHGLLHRIRDLGLALISITRAEPDPPRDAVPLLPTDH